MAVKYDGTFFQEPTGAVEFDDSPQEYGIGVDQTPTGAVENSGQPVTTKFGPSGMRSTGAVTLPETQSFQAPGVKVINAPQQPSPKGATTAETDNQAGKPQTGSTRTQRASHQSDDEVSL